MYRHHQSPRHLDDPLRPVFGLSVAQAFGALLAAAAAFGTWLLLGRLSAPAYALTEMRIFATGTIAALVFFAVYALSGDRGEPYARQLWAYARRGHHYAPNPLVTTQLEDAHDRTTPAATPATRQLRAAAHAVATFRVGAVRRDHRR